MAESSLDKIKELERDDFGARFRVMDEDRDLLLTKKYVMTQENHQAVPNVHNVTLPLPIIRANRLISYLSSANTQTEVSGKGLDDKATTAIEEFLKALDYEVDRRLSRRGMPAMQTVQARRLFERGRIVARSLIREQDGEILWDVIPIDGRFFVYEMDENGLTFAASKTRKSKAEIERLYGIQISDKKADVWDSYDEEKNEIWVGDMLGRQQANPYKYVPHVVQLVPAGAMIDDDEAVGSQGESIFEMVRGLYPELNRFATIQATLTQRSFMQNMQYESEAGEDVQPPETPGVDGQRVYPVEKGGGFKAMPIVDTNNAARLLWAIISDLEQKGTLADVNYGTLSFPLSAVAISNLTEGRDNILIPRLQAYAMYKEGLSRMCIKQALATGLPLEVGEEGHKETYNSNVLEGDYSIKYRFFTPSKEQQIADASICNALGDKVSDDYKRREILKLQDPDGEKAKVESELAAKLDPVIMVFQTAHSLVEQKRYVEAKIMADRGVKMLTMPPQIVPPESKKPVDAVPLMDKGGGRAGQPKDELQKVAAEARRD